MTSNGSFSTRRRWENSLTRTFTPVHQRNNIMAQNDILQPQIQANGTHMGSCFCITCRQRQLTDIINTQTIDEMQRKISGEIKDTENNLNDQILSHTLKKILYLDAFRVTALSPRYNVSGLK